MKSIDEVFERAMCSWPRFRRLPTYGGRVPGAFGGPGGGFGGPGGDFNGNRRTGGATFFFL